MRIARTRELSVYSGILEQAGSTMRYIFLLCLGDTEHWKSDPVDVNQGKVVISGKDGKSGIDMWLHLGDIESFTLRVRTILIIADNHKLVNPS